jgi:uncharacterized membrane protein YgcG
VGIEDKFKSTKAGTRKSSVRDEFHASPEVKAIGRIKHELRQSAAKKKAKKQTTVPPSNLRKGGAQYREAAPTSEINVSGFEVKMPKGKEAFHAVRERAALDLAEQFKDDPAASSFARELAAEHGDAARRSRGGGGGGSRGGGGGSGGKAQKRHPAGSPKGGQFA